MNTTTPSRMPEVQAAVRALTGVGAASIAWPEPGGPATLRIELQAGADRGSVTAAVLDTIQRVGGADLSSFRVALPPPPGGHAAPAGGPEPAASAVPDGHAQPAAEPDPPAPDAPAGRAPGRPVFEAIALQRGAMDVAVTVTLTHGGRRLVGEATGLATRQAALRVAAAATLGAVRELLPAGMRVQVDWVEVHGAEHPARPAVVHVAVALLSSAVGEQVVIGSALVRDDVRDAAVRATLDALNRRLTYAGGGD